LVNKVVSSNVGLNIDFDILRVLFKVVTWSSCQNIPGKKYFLLYGEVASDGEAVMLMLYSHQFVFRLELESAVILSSEWYTRWEAKILLGRPLAWEFRQLHSICRMKIQLEHVVGGEY
jgi:hypothetical protein